MNKLHRKFFVLLVLSIAFAQASAKALPKRIEAFDAAVWSDMQAKLKQPTVVLFSATWCPNCPAVMDGLAKEIKRRKLNAQLLAVVMDVAPGEADASLLANPHYRMTNRLFAFNGQSAAIQYAVDPKWQGLTPYVVFLAPNAEAFAVVGSPRKNDFDRWMLGARDSVSPAPTDNLMR